MLTALAEGRPFDVDAAEDSDDALPGEEAEFSLTSELTYPIYIPPDSRCSKSTFVCADDSARQARSQRRGW